MTRLQLLSMFTIITACFDLYCYAMAAPGSTHYGYYVISYEFVYVGSRHGKYIDILGFEMIIIDYVCFSSKHFGNVCSILDTTVCGSFCYQHNVNNCFTKGRFSFTLSFFDLMLLL